MQEAEARRAQETEAVRMQEAEARRARQLADIRAANEAERAKTQAEAREHEEHLINTLKARVNELMATNHKQAQILHHQAEAHDSAMARMKQEVQSARRERDDALAKAQAVSNVEMSGRHRYQEHGNSTREMHSTMEAKVDKCHEKTAHTLAKVKRSLEMKAAQKAMEGPDQGGLRSSALFQSNRVESA